MSEDKVEGSPDLADYSHFKIVDVEKTEVSGILTFHNVEGRITRQDEEKKAMQTAIDTFRKEAPKAIRVITSTVNAATQQVKMNIKVLQNSATDDEKKKKVIRQIKEAENSQEKSEKLKDSWNKLQDLYMDVMLDVEEENYANEWMYSEQEKKTLPFEKVHKEAKKIA